MLLTSQAKKANKNTANFAVDQNYEIINSSVTQDDGFQKHCYQ